MSSEWSKTPIITKTGSCANTIEENASALARSATIHHGCESVFVDWRGQGYDFGPHRVEEKVTTHTKAIVIILALS